ncbi:MAG: hypothetical protein ACTS2F_20770 [Thainema sp.]
MFPTTQPPNFQRSHLIVLLGGTISLLFGLWIFTLTGNSIYQIFQIFQKSTHELQIVMGGEQIYEPPLNSQAAETAHTSGGVR